MKKILVMIALMLSFLVGNDADRYMNLGYDSYKDGDYNKALEYLNKALDIRKQILGEKHVDTAASYNNIGVVYYSLGDYNKALEYHYKALNIQKKILGGNHKDIGISYNNIGNNYSYLGDYDKALEFLNKALNIQKKILGDKHKNTAISYNNIGFIYSNLGNYNKALEYYSKALNIKKQILGEKDPDTATSYNNVGNIYLYLGEYDKALEFLNKALSIKKQILGENHPSIAITYSNIANVYNDLGYYNKSMKYYNKSIKYQNKALNIKKQILGENHPDVATSYNGIGSAYANIGNYSKALEYYNKSLIIWKKILGENHPDTVFGYNNVALVYYASGNYSQSYNNIKKAYEIYSLNKDKNFKILSSLQKKSFINKNKGYINNLLLVGYHMKPSHKTKKEIYEYFINDKDDIFNSENILVTIASKDKSMKEKVDELNTLKRDLGKLQANVPDEGDLKTYNEKIKSLENDIENKEIELSKLAPSFKEYHELKNITLKDLQAYLKDNELFIDFGYQGDNYYAFSMDKNGVVEFNMLDSNASKSLDEDIKTFRKDIDFIQDNINSAKLADFDKLNKSSKKTLAKINSVLNSLLKDRVKNYSSLIVSSDGALRLLPFEALYDGDKYLLEKYDIRYTPSAKEYIRTHRYNTNKAKQKATLFSDPNYEVISGKNISLAVTTPNTTKELETRSNSNLSGFLRLRGFKVEQNALQDRIKNISLYDREKANEENLFKLTSPEILHIITHGYFISDENIQNPMLKSGIALSGANLGLREKSDIGLVNALKLSGLELNGTNLIALSACETGKVDINDTSSIASLPKTFIQAGARNVLMSLWKVEDKHTVRLMDELYSGKNYNKTLKEAKLSMIKENLHPFFWAAFILSGE